MLESLRDRGETGRRATDSPTSENLVDWVDRGLIAGDVRPGIPIIDGALAFWKGHHYLLFKDRESQEPYFTRTRDAALDSGWIRERRLILGSGEVDFGIGDGFAENFQLIAIDGTMFMIATARDPEGHRFPSIYTGSHEPFAYTMVRGDGTALEDWTTWRKMQLRIPYESWNPVMHANTGHLLDLREHDGFFYLTYSGSDDFETFDGRGHGMIGIARSRDLIHWRVAGDLRD